MANLLPRKTVPFPPFTDEQRARFEERARFLVGRTRSALVEALPELAAELESDLEELDALPSLASAQAILARIDALRLAALGRPARRLGAAAQPAHHARRQPGGWILYRPGRSEGTGEAEVASRGYFDVRDRPPLATWVEVLARPRAEGSGDLDLAVLCYVPNEARDRVTAGRRACPSGSLKTLEELAPGFVGELASLLEWRA